MTAQGHARPLSLVAIHSCDGQKYVLREIGHWEIGHWEKVYCNLIKHIGNAHSNMTIWQINILCYYIQFNIVSNLIKKHAR